MKPIFALLRLALVLVFQCAVFSLGAADLHVFIVYDGDQTSIGSVRDFELLKAEAERIAENTQLRLIPHYFTQSSLSSESFQQELLARRAVFIAVQLETMEAKALDGEDIDVGVYTQGANALSGLLTKLGLKKAAKQAVALDTYLSNGRRRR